jgi:hypothetical protein
MSMQFHLCRRNIRFHSAAFVFAACKVVASHVINLNTETCIFELCAARRGFKCWATCLLCKGELRSEKMLLTALLSLAVTAWHCRGQPHPTTSEEWQGKRENQKKEVRANSIWMYLDVPARCHVVLTSCFITTGTCEILLASTA